MSEIDIAVEQLRVLAKVPGALKIITNEVRPELREDRKDRRSPAAAKLLKDDPELLKHHRAFVVHDVVAIEGPDPQGYYTASSAEGDLCVGVPANLLKRLLEASLS